LNSHDGSLDALKAALLKIRTIVLFSSSARSATRLWVKQ
jgi:hypothetical protein